MIFSSLIDGLAELAQPNTLALMLVGVCIGVFVGILPGLGGAVTIALLLPFTFGMEPTQGFAFLLAVWVATATAGDITSILFGIPGEATTAAAVLDGYPMTRNGEAGRALGASLLTSTVGVMFGAIVFWGSISLIRPLILSIGPPQLLMLALFGLAFVASLSGRSLLNGLLIAVFGVFLSLIGLDPMEGIPRYSFGSLYLWQGIDIIPVVVGLFGGAEVLALMLSRSSISDRTEIAGPYRGLRQGVGDVGRHWWLVLRCSAIGTGVGLAPGMGGAVAQYLAYGHAKQTSKDPESFGDGNVEGVLAASACSTSKDGGALLPTVAFGIPGSVTTAILLSAFLMFGIQPGPEMLTTHLTVTTSMGWAMVVANIAAVAISLALLPALTRLTVISGHWLVPILALVLTLGAYSAHNSYGDIVIMLASAVVGVIAIRYDWPRVPFLLGLILGGLVERYFFISYSIAGWQWLMEPSVVVMGLLALIVIFGRPVSQSLVSRRRSQGSASSAEEDRRMEEKRR